MSSEKEYCPSCHSKLEKFVVTYYKVEKGVFRSNIVVTETTLECPKCGWSTWKKEELKT